MPAQAGSTNTGQFMPLVVWDGGQCPPYDRLAGSICGARNGEGRRVAMTAGPREAAPGFEPGMVDLQSTALATWLRRLTCRFPSRNRGPGPANVAAGWSRKVDRHFCSVTLRGILSKILITRKGQNMASKIAIDLKIDQDRTGGRTILIPPSRPSYGQASCRDGADDRKLTQSPHNESRCP